MFRPLYVPARLRLASSPPPTRQFPGICKSPQQIPHRLRQDAISLTCAHGRRCNRAYTTHIEDAENLNVSHSRFLAERNRSAKWKRDDEDWGGETDLKDSEDIDNLAEGKGKPFFTI